MARTNPTQIPLKQDTDRQINDMESTMKTHITGPEDRFNEWTAGLTKTIVGHDENMMRWHAYNNLIRDIPIYDRMNMGLADWLLHIEKVAILTNSQEYELAAAKSTSTLTKYWKEWGMTLVGKTLNEN